MCVSVYNRHEGDATEGPARVVENVCSSLFDDFSDDIVEVPPLCTLLLSPICLGSSHAAGRAHVLLTCRAHVLLTCRTSIPHISITCPYPSLAMCMLYSMRLEPCLSKGRRRLKNAIHDPCVLWPVWLRQCMCVVACVQSTMHVCYGVCAIDRQTASKECNRQCNAQDLVANKARVANKVRVAIKARVA